MRDAIGLLLSSFAEWNLHVGSRRRARFIVSLALRLGEHLAQRLGKPDTATILPIGEAAGSMRFGVQNAELGKLPIAAQSLVRAGGNEAL